MSHRRIARLAASLLAAASLLLFVPLSRPALGQAESPGVPAEFIVAASPEAAEEAGLTVLAESGFGWTLVEGPALAGVAPDAMAERLSAVTGFEVEPNFVYQLAEEPLFPDQWSLENTGQTGGTADADIDILDAWEWTSGSADVVIAVIDTGVALTHPDLASNLWVNPGEVAGNAVDDDGNGYVDDVNGWDALDNDSDPSDTHGHGTFVATTAAAVVNEIGMAGVAPESAVMAIRVCAIDGCPLFAILGGLAYATANGADVANLSFGGNIGFSTSFETAIRDGVEAGMTIAAAAGNESSNNDSTPFYPAGFGVDGLIAVAATNHNDGLAYFSNYGVASVDLVAPGEDVIGGLPPDGWGMASGTSFAAPLVSGVAALLEALRPELSPVEIAELVMATADPVPGLSGRVTTGGRLNAGAAVELATAPVAVASASPNSGVLPFIVHLDGSASYDPLGEIVSWSWKLPGGVVVAGPEADWSPTRPGAYQGVLTVVDDDGFTDTAVVTIEARLRPGGTFVDDNGHFAEGAIEAIAAEAITKGCNPPANDRYCPEDPVTRGQMAAFLARALRLPASTDDFFGDDEDSVFEAAINKLAAAGITKGCNPPANTRFCPEAPVTRGEMAAFLARAFGLMDGAGFDIFVDDDGSVFETAIDKIGTARITTGCNPPTNDHYCPDAEVTRGEMAVFLTRAQGLSPIYPPP